VGFSIVHEAATVGFSIVHEAATVDYNIVPEAATVDYNIVPEAATVDYKTDAESLVVNYSQPEVPSMDMCNKIWHKFPVDIETECEGISLNHNIESKDSFLDQEVHPLAMCLDYGHQAWIPLCTKWHKYLK
jgi:hypothetical protein